MGHVFISHCGADRDATEQIAAGLEAVGYRAWYYERDSLPGLSYLIQTGQAIEESGAVVILISPQALESHQMGREVVRTHECNKAVVPVLRGLTHPEFQVRQPEWREALGAATSLAWPADGADGMPGRIAAGLRAMGIAPGAPAGTPPISAPPPTSTKRPARRRWIAIALVGAIAGAVWALTLPGLRQQRHAAQNPSLKTPSTSQPDLADVPAGRRLPRVAVLYFVNNSPEQSGLNSLQKGLCSIMISDLGHAGGYELVERERIEEILKELRLTRGAEFDPASAARIGKLAGAQYLLFGSFLELAGRFRLDARLVEVERGTIAATSGTAGKPDDFDLLAQKVIDELVQQQKNAPPDVQALPASSHAAADLAAVVQFGQALDRYDTGDKAGAREALSALVRSHPDFAAAVTELTRLGSRP